MRYLIWDFDGTLGYRIDPWSGALLQVLEEALPGRAFDADLLRARLRSGFPWHTPDAPHEQLSSSDLWWEALEPVFVRAFEAAGMGPASHSLAKRVRRAYVAPDRWRLFEDTLPVLRALSARGWAHLVLSNHVPELAEITDHLGLDDHLSGIFNSAESGYEKPHPRAFDGVLDAIRGADSAWMIGDNPEADVRGAEVVGIPAILVRGRDGDVRHRCEDLFGVPDVLEKG